MTVKEYLDKRNDKDKKRIRIINLRTGGGWSDWTLYAHREIFKVSVTSKFIFIYIN